MGIPARRFPLPGRPTGGDREPPGGPTPFPFALGEAVAHLGPLPRASLRSLLDLGMTEAEIARYHRISIAAIAELRIIWQV